MMAGRQVLGQPPVSEVRNLRVRADALYIASGWSTLMTDPHGRIDGVDPQGFYAQNTRVLCRERIIFDDHEPIAFSTGNVGVHAQLSYAELRNGESLPSQGAYLMKQRFVGEGLRTRLVVASYSDAPLTMRLRVELDADFADIGEVDSGVRRQTGDVTRAWQPELSELMLTYQHERLDRAVAIRVHAPAPVRYDNGVVSVDLIVPPRESLAVDLVVEPVFDGHRATAPPATYAEPNDSAARARTVLAHELAQLRSSNRDVAATWQTAVGDLANLPLGEPPGPAAPIAGLPIYQEIFGRDTLTASFQALLAGPTMLRDSLRLNAAHLGKRVDDWRDEEPGKPLHESRRGPVSLLGLDPFDAYYGDWATGPDFLALLGQYLSWTGDLDTVRDLLPAASQIVDWLDRHGDPDHDGFLEYETRSPAGVKNQGWKDSTTAIVDEYGESIENPIATSELQGYWYGSMRYGATAFAAGGRRLLAARLIAKAGALRRRFHDTFWMKDLGSYAMALGPDKRQVRSVTSNDGHLLATGIVPPRFAPVVARRLLAPDMFSGWGIRTLSADHPAYNPFSYHRGSVWPVEAGTISLGLARYGCWDQMHQLAEATFSAATLFEGHRLPEVISGLPRDREHPHPGVYPGSCSPQAWSASSIVALMQALLALRPFAPLRCIFVDPHLPEWLSDLTLEGVRVGGATFDLNVRRRRHGRISVRTRGDRIAVIRSPTLLARSTSARR